MRHFAIVLALAVAAWTQAMASEAPHKRHLRMPRQAEVDTAPGCPGYHHRGVSGWASVAAVAAVAAAEATGAGSTECEPGALILMGIRPERTQ